MNQDSEPTSTSCDCECEICRRDRAFRLHLAQLADDQQMYFNAMYDALQHAEMDRDYYHAILDGSWPNAEVIRDAMKLARERDGHA